MSHSATATSSASDASDLIPAEWPPVRTDVPSPVWTIRGVLALPGMILLWFSPKRAGASLAAAGWGAAVAAHLLGLALGIGLIVWAESFHSLNPFATHLTRSFGFMESSYPAVEMSPYEYSRGPFAALALTAHESSAGVGSLGPFVLTFMGIEFGLLVVAVAMMPFAAAGERASLLFGRTLRLTWWSTTLLIPLGIAWLVEPVMREWVGLPSGWHAVDYAALALFSMWWVFVLLRSGYRYAGPPNGPAWEVRRPRCESCGYTIAYLLHSTRCPECGRPVTQSLPDRRQQPPLSVTASFAETFRTFWPTARATVSGRSFFDRLSVCRGHDRARTFFLVTSILNALLLFMGIAALGFLVGGDVFTRNMLAGAVVASCAWMFFEVFLAGILAVIFAAAGRRPLRPTAVTAFYALASLRPLIVLLLGVLFALWPVAVIIDGAVSVPVSILLVLLAAFALAGSCWLALVAIKNIRSAFRQTRFANG